MLTIIINDSDWSAPWWKSYCCFKNVTINERVIRYTNFIFWRSDVSVTFNELEPGDQPFPKLLLCSSKFLDARYLSLFVFGYHHFIVALMLI